MWISVLFGHQVTPHERPSEVLSPGTRGVRHFGAILPWDEWRALVDRLSSLGPPVISGPTFAHVGTGREQAKILLCHSSDNIIEIKAYCDASFVLAAPSGPDPAPPGTAESRT